MNDLVLNPIYNCLTANNPGTSGTSGQTGAGQGASLPATAQGTSTTAPRAAAPGRK